MNKSNLTKFVKKIIVFFIYIFVVLTITVLTLELLLRVLKPYNLNVFDEKIRLIYNKKYKIKNFNKKLDNYVYFTKNSIGFRGDEPPKNFSEYLTIIVSGGSTTENARLTDEKEWTHLLGKRLSNDFNKVWINNAGFAGHSTKAQLDIIKNHIIELHPKVVIILTGINDLGNVERERYLATKKIPVLLEKGFDFLRRRSYLFSFLHYLNEQIICRIVGLGYRLDFNLEKIKEKEISQREEIEIKNIHKEKMPFFRNNLQEIINILKENKIKVVFVSQSTLCGNRVDVTTKKDLAKIKVGLLNGKLYNEILNLYNDTVKNVAEKNDIFFIDLESNLEKKYDYYFDYIHYTNQGSEAVSAIIYKELLPFLKKEFTTYKK